MPEPEDHDVSKEIPHCHKTKHTLADLLQASRSKALGNCGGLEVNVAKCAATVLQYAKNGQESSGSALALGKLERLFQQQISNDETIPQPFLDISKMYCYLDLGCTGITTRKYSVKMLKETVLGRGSKSIFPLLSLLSDPGVLHQASNNYMIL